MPSQAESFYVRFLNQTRNHEDLLPDPTGPRTIPRSVPTKWAVLSVLSTKCSLSVCAIQFLLAGTSYQCARSAIKLALNRSSTFGLVVKGRFRYEDGVIRRRAAHVHNKWKLTARGLELINAPRKPMKQTVGAAIRTVMEQATSWLSVADIHAAVNTNRSTIRSHLRRDSAYKSIGIPGDCHGARQWALATADTTDWANAAPSPKSSQKQAKKTKTAPAGSPVSASQPATYGGLVLMCAPTNKPSLIRAIGDLLVNEFVTSGKKFSAHDVTKRLREKVLDDAMARAKTPVNPLPSLPPAQIIDPNETGTVGVNGFRVAKIEHEDVKAVVHDIFNAGGMPNLSRRRDASDQYWEYGPAASLLQVSVTADPQQPADVTGSTTDPDPINGGTMGSTYDGSSTI